MAQEEIIPDVLSDEEMGRFDIPDTMSNEEMNNLSGSIDLGLTVPEQNNDKPLFDEETGFGAGANYVADELGITRATKALRGGDVLGAFKESAIEGLRGGLIGKEVLKKTKIVDAWGQFVDDVKNNKGWDASASGIEATVATVAAPFTLAISGIASTLASVKLLALDSMPAALEARKTGDWSKVVPTKEEFDKAEQVAETAVNQIINPIGYAAGVIADVANKPKEDVFDIITGNFMSGRTIGQAIQEEAKKAGVEGNTLASLVSRLGGGAVDLALTVGTFKAAHGLTEPIVIEGPGGIRTYTERPLARALEGKRETPIDRTKLTPEEAGPSEQPTFMRTMTPEEQARLNPVQQRLYEASQRGAELAKQEQAMRESSSPETKYIDDVKEWFNKQEFVPLEKLTPEATRAMGDKIYRMINEGKDEIPFPERAVEDTSYTQRFGGANREGAVPNIDIARQIAKERNADINAKLTKEQAYENKVAKDTAQRFGTPGTNVVETRKARATEARELLRNIAKEKEANIQQGSPKTAESIVPEAVRKSIAEKQEAIQQKRNMVEARRQMNEVVKNTPDEKPIPMAELEAKLGEFTPKPTDVKPVYPIEQMIQAKEKAPVKQKNVPEVSGYSLDQRKFIVGKIIEAVGSPEKGWDTSFPEGKRIQIAVPGGPKLDIVASQEAISTIVKKLRPPKKLDVNVPPVIRDWMGLPKERGFLNLWGDANPLEKSHVIKDVDRFVDTEIPTFLRNKLKTENDAMKAKLEMAGVDVDPALESHMRSELTRLPNEEGNLGVKGTIDKIMLPKTAGQKAASTLKFLYDNTIRSGQSSFRRMGKWGNVLADKIEELMYLRDRKSGPIVNDLNKLFNKMSKEELNNFVDAAQGEKAMSPLVSEAVKVWDKYRSDVAVRAQQKQLTIRMADGSNKPWQPREDYFPRYIDFREVMNNRDYLENAIAHIRDVEAKKMAGQSKTTHPEWTDNQAYNDAYKNFTNMDAYKKLQAMAKNSRHRLSGSLEHAREYNFTSYERDPRIVTSKYILDSERRLAEVDIFGKNDEVAQDIFNKIDADSYKGKGESDAVNAEGIFKRIVGDISEKEMVLREKLQPLTTFQVLTKMTLSPISNAFQTTNSITRLGFKNFAKEFVKFFKDKEASRDWGMDSGSVMTQTIAEYMDVNNLGYWYLKKLGFSQIEMFNRILTANMAKSYALDMFARLKKNPYDAKALKEFKRLKVDDTVLKESIANGELNMAALKEVSQRLTAETQFRGTAYDLNPNWTTPVGRVLTQFKSFAYNQSRFVYENVLKEARRGNFAPLIRIAVAGGISGEILKDLKDLIRNKPQRELPTDTKELLFRAAENVTVLGMGGLYVDMLQSANSKGGQIALADFFMGPTGADVVDITGDVLSGRPDSLAKDLTGKIPFVGPTVKGYVFPKEEKKPKLEYE